MNVACRFAALAVLLNAPLFAAEPQYEWKKVTLTAPFAARDGAGSLTFQGKMWLIGGWNPGDKKFFPRICNNEVWNSTDGAAWTLIKPNSFLDQKFDAAKDWEGRHTAGYVVYKDKMWIIGGDVNQGHYQNDVWNSSDGKTWTFVNPDKPVPWGPRALHYTVVHDGKIWILGGQTMPAFGNLRQHGVRFRFRLDFRRDERHRDALERRRFAARVSGARDEDIRFRVVHRRVAGADFVKLRDAQPEPDSFFVVRTLRVRNFGTRRVPATQAAASPGNAIAADRRRHP